MIAILFVFHYHMALNTEDEQYDITHRRFTMQMDITKHEADDYIQKIRQERGRELRSVFILLADYPVKANYLYYSPNGRFTNIGQYFKPEDFVITAQPTGVIAPSPAKIEVPKAPQEKPAVPPPAKANSQISPL
jgi:alkyl hydroperoxide reductase subunit AhpC